MATRTCIVALLFCLSLLISERAFAGSFLVSSKAELEVAVSMAQPGDSIILKDQVWAGVEMLFTCKGTAEQPINICPETPGGASLEAGSRIEIGGEYLVVSGFRIVNGSNLNSAVLFSSGEVKAYHCRLSHCLIDGWNPPDLSTKYHWVVLHGGYNRVDHCRFSNMNHRGVTLMVKAGADQVGHHQIDHNFFGPKPDGDGNGYESIKMGGGDYSMYPLYTTVEKNYFYRCDGEVELISNKSWNNTYRHNTFYESSGTLTLRWGRQCLVEGNYFLGNGRKETGGIRISDQDHLIINNYLENLTGDDARAAISVMSGIPDTEGGNSGHGQTKNARILHNTIINCKESINMGYFDDDDLGDPRGDLTAPENCTLAQNIIWSSYAPLIEEQWEPSINTTWLSNMAWGAALGLESDSGFILEDPLLELSPSGIYNIAEGSPAIDAGTILGDTVHIDFEKQYRDDGRPDIGADELSDGVAEKLPIGPEDVGPHWLAGTRVNKPAAIAALRVYPNPAHQRFFLILDSKMLASDIRVEILDMAGRTVHTAIFLNVQANPEIVVTDLEGLHLLRLHSKHGDFHTKIIFKK